MGRWRRIGAALAAAGVAAASVVAGEAVCAPSAGAASVLPSPITTPMWLATESGAVEAYGVPALGSAPGPLNQPIVGTATTPDRAGYWLVASDGGVFTFGDAGYFGSTGDLRLNRPIVGMAPTPDGRGYWLVASDGGVFCFGDAAFFGSTGALQLNQPVVAMAATADGSGYWLVASDGGVFTFGTAAFHGSTGSLTLTEPVVAATPTPGGGGYWLVAGDGGIFAFGDAAFFGSGATTTVEPFQRLVTTADGRGYWLLRQDGTALAFGDATSRALAPQALLLHPVTPGDRAVLFAFAQVGKPYIWGGNGPVGYDCSGLALASWVHGAGVSFARVANDQFHTAGDPVALADLRAGDLVFWGSDLADWTSVYHTGIYVGGNRIVESTGDHVQINSLAQWGLSDVMGNGRRP